MGHDARGRLRGGWASSASNRDRVTDEPTHDLHSSLGSSAMSLVGGATLGDYELLEELGRGGMGVVYKARQPASTGIVALKMILRGDHGRRRPTWPASAARPRPPRGSTTANIVPVYEVGEHDGQPYFA